jgi:hypothetical protein
METRVQNCPPVHLTFRCECGRSGSAVPVAVELEQTQAGVMAVVPGRELALAAMFHCEDGLLLCGECWRGPRDPK